MEKAIENRCAFNSFAHDFEIYIKEHGIQVTKLAEGRCMEVYYYTPYNMPRSEIKRQNKELGLNGLNLEGNKNGLIH